VQGTYAQAYDLCTQACQRFGWYNRNAAINPYLVEGKKTGGLEAAEQSADDPPDWIVCSVGDGCSIAGVHKGVVEMKAIGVDRLDGPHFGSAGGRCRADCGSIQTGKLDRSGRGDTYADSINVPVPRNWRKAVDAVRQSNGAYVTATDGEIMKAVPLTGRLTGVFAEPAAATTIAGIATARERGVLDAKSNVLAMITGNGLKDIQGALKAVGEPFDVQPTLDAVLAIVQKS